MTPTRYVLCLVFSPDHQRVMTLEKRSGPALLLGRICGVGGKIEPGETEEQAASRETQEETHLAIDPSEWRPVARCSGEGWQMRVLSCQAELSSARQGEHEPIAERSVRELLLAAIDAPDSISPDLAVFLAMALQQRQRPFDAQLLF